MTLTVCGYGRADPCRRCQNRSMCIAEGCRGREGVTGATVAASRRRRRLEWKHQLIALHFAEQELQAALKADGDAQCSHI